VVPIPRHDFLGDANWGVNNSTAAGSWDGTIDPVWGNAPAGPYQGTFPYPTFVQVTVTGTVTQVPGALPGQGIVRTPYAAPNDPNFWGAIGFNSNGGTWWAMNAVTVLRIVSSISPFRNNAGGQPQGDWAHCGYQGYALCWSWSGSAHLDFSRYPVDLTLTRSPDSTIWAGAAVMFTAGMSPASVPGDSHPIVMAELQWRWIPDSASTADTLGCGSASGGSCTRVLTTSGTMYAAAYVNGQQQQQSIHVVVVPGLTVDADRTSVKYADTVTFTPKYRGAVTTADRWRWAPDSAGTSDTTSCAGGTSTCKRRIRGSGVMWAYKGQDSASARVEATPVPCPIDSEPALNDPDVRRALMLLLQHSNYLLVPGSGIAQGDSVGDKRELAGDIWRRPDGTYYFSQDTHMPYSTECRLQRSNISTSQSSQDVKVYDVHIEPVEYGEMTYGCAPNPLGEKYQQGPWDTLPPLKGIPLKQTNEKLGGGSLSDWKGIADLPENAGVLPSVSGLVITASGEIWKLPADKLWDAQHQYNVLAWLHNTIHWKWNRNADPQCNW
jgi:hypothetical protein